MTLHKRIGLACLFGTLLCSFVGCGEPDFYTCSGIVTHDGKPVDGLEINFAPDLLDSVRPPIAMSKEGGKFEMKTARNRGVPPGTYTIHIMDPAAANGGDTSKQLEGDAAVAYRYVVDRYSPQKSDLKYTADAHRSDFEIKLDTAEYSGPKVKEDKVQNTTDD